MVQSHLDCARDGAAAEGAGNVLQPRLPAVPSGGRLPGLISSPSGGKGGGALRAVIGPKDHRRPSKEPASACADGEIPTVPAAGTADAAVGVLSAGVASPAPLASASLPAWVNRNDGAIEPLSSADAERERLGDSFTVLDRSSGAWTESLRRIDIDSGDRQCNSQDGRVTKLIFDLLAHTWCAAAFDWRRYGNR